MSLLERNIAEQGENVSSPHGDLFTDWIFVLVNNNIYLFHMTGQAKTEVNESSRLHVGVLELFPFVPEKKLSVYIICIYSSE